MTCSYLEEIFIAGDPEIKTRKYCHYFQYEPEEIDCKDCYVKNTILKLHGGVI
jgi:uncharacterized protein (UPF0179 family)